MSIKASENLRSFIMKHEKFEPEAYDDGLGNITQGYGNTNGVGGTVTEDAARKTMEDNIRGAEDYLNKNVRPDIAANLPQNRKDVLVDMRYNLRTASMDNFLDRLNSGEDVSESIKQYTKGRDNRKDSPTYGQLVEMGGLVKRASERHAMWTGGQEQPQIVSDAEPINDANIAAFEEYERAGEEDPTADANIDEFEAQEKLGMLTPEEENINRLDMASNIADPQTALRNSEAQRIADETGMDLDVAKAKLAEMPITKVMAQQQHDIIAKRFPSIAKFVGRDPHNYVLLEENPQKLKKIAVKAKVLRPEERSNVDKVLDQNSVMLESAALRLATALGRVGKKESIAYMRELDARTRANVMSGSGADAVNKAMEKYTQQDGEFLDLMSTLIKYPKDAALTSLQSQGSTIATMGATMAAAPGGAFVGGMAGAQMGHPLTAVMGMVLGGAGAGATAAYSVSHLLSFDEEFKKQLQENYGNPATGEIDYEAAYADEAFMKRVVTDANIYGFTMGGSDALFSLIGGKLGSKVAKFVFKKAPKSALGKFAKGAISVGAQATGKSAEEAGSQYVASSSVNAKQFYYDELFDKEKFDDNQKKIAKDSVIEGLMSFGPGAVGPTISHMGDGAAYIYRRHKDAAIKTKDDLKQSNKANQDAAAAADVQAEVHSEPEKASKLSGLVDDTIETDPNQIDMFAPTKSEDEIEQNVAAEVQKMDKEANENIVAISPAEWIKYHELNGGDPYEAIRMFGADVAEQFHQNKELDTSFHVPTGLWADATIQDPGLVQIVRFNGNKYNTVEANETIEGYEKKPFTLFDAINPNDPIYGQGTHNLIDDKEKVEALRKKDTLVNDLALRAMELRNKAGGSESTNLMGHENPFVQLAIDAWLKAHGDLHAEAHDAGLSTELALNNERDFIREYPEYAQPDLSKLVADRLKLLEESDGDESGPEDLNKPGEGKPMEIIEADSADGNVIMRPVELMMQGKTPEETEIAKGFLARMRKVLAGSRADNAGALEGLDVMAEIYIRHLRRRAAVTGRSVQDLADRLQIGRVSKSDEMRGTNGYFTPSSDIFGKLVIAFSGGATIKTVPHELGHMWLHEMGEDWEHLKSIPDDKLTPVQREYKEASIKLAELLGLDEISDILFDPTHGKLSWAQIVHAHERFSQTTEHYFLDGHFENSKIKALMNTFRKWMVGVIDLIGKTYPQHPPLKITPEIERIFEAILGVSELAEDTLVPMREPPTFHPDILGPAYQKAIDDAWDMGVGTLYTEAFLKGLRQREKEIDQASGRITKQCEEELDKRPSMQMLKNFKASYKAYQDDKKNGGQIGLTEPRFSFESIQKVLMGNDILKTEQVKKAIPNELMTGKKKGGIDITDFMAYHNITDPGQMLAMLLETAKRPEMLASMIKKQIDEEFPLTKNEDEIHQKAVEALNNKGRDEILKQEFAFIAQKLGTLKGIVSKLMTPVEYMKRTTKEALKAEAIEVVLNTRAFKFSANRFLNEYARHARDAARKVKANDIMGVAKAKEKEGVHFYAYKIGREIQKELAKGRQRAENLIAYAQSKDYAKDFDTDMMRFGYHLIQAAENGLPIIKLTRGQIGDLSGVSAGHIDNINKAIDAFTADAQANVGDKMTVRSALLFSELLRTIMVSARQAKEIEIDGDLQKLDATAAQTSMDFEAVNAVVDFDGDGVMGGKRRRAFLTAETVLSSMYSSPEAFIQSPLGKMFYKIKEMESVVNVEYAKYRKRIDEKVKKTIADKALKQAILEPWRKVSNRDGKLLAHELGFVFNNIGELITAIALMGSESGADKFLQQTGKGRAFDPTTGKVMRDNWNRFIKRMADEGVLRKEHFDLVQEIWDIFEEVHPLVKKAMRKSDGFNMGHVKAEPMQTPFGSFSGGYFPITSSEHNKQADINEMLNVDMMGYEAQSVYQSWNLSNTKQRSDARVKLDLDLGKLPARLSSSLRIAYMRNPMLDFGKVMTRPEVTDVFESRRPGAFKGVIMPWFKRTAVQEYTEYSDGALDAWARILKQGTNMSLYFVQGFTPIKQYFGAIPAIKFVGAKALTTSALKVHISPKSTKADIEAKSPFMANRFEKSVKDIVRSWDKLDTNFHWTTTTKERVDQITYIAIQTCQNQVDAMVWHAAYEKARKTMVEADAVTYADRIVAKSQSSSSVSDMSNAQAGKDLQKAIMMVTTVPIAMHNMMIEDVMRQEGVSRKVATGIYIGLFTALLPAIADVAFSLTVDKLAKDDDEEEKEDEESDDAMIAAMRVAGGSLDTALPFGFRPMTSAMEYGQTSVSPAISALNKLPEAYKAGQNTYKGVDWSARETKAFWNTLTVFSGIPFVAISRGVSVNEFFKDSDEKMEDKMERQNQLQEYKFDNIGE